MKGERGTITGFAAIIDGKVILSSIASTEEALYERMCECLEIDMATLKGRGYNVVPVEMYWETYDI